MTTTTQEHEHAGQTGGCCGGKKQAVVPEKPASEKPRDAAKDTHGCCKSTT